MSDKLDDLVNKIKLVIDNELPNVPPGGIQIDVQGDNNGEINGIKLTVDVNSTNVVERERTLYDCSEDELVEERVESRRKRSKAKVGLFKHWALPVLALLFFSFLSNPFRAATLLAEYSMLGFGIPIFVGVCLYAFTQHAKLYNAITVYQTERIELIERLIWERRNSR